MGSLNFLLGIEMIRISEGFHLSQYKYIHKLLEKAQSLDPRLVYTSLLSGKTISKFDYQPLEDCT